MVLRVAGGPVRGRRIRGLRGDPYGRRFLLDAATQLVLPGFAYTRSGPALWLPQQDGSLFSFGPDVPPRSWGVGGWGYEFHPGWTQYITRTHDFSHSTWTKRRATVVPVSMPTPDGLNSAFKVVEDTTAANSHYIESEFVAIAATRGCFVVKAGEVTEIGIRFIRDTGVSFGGANTRMNLLTGEVTLGTLNVEALSGGWWKVTGLPDGTATTNVSIRLSLVKSGSETYTGDGTSGVFVMAANLTNTLYPVPLTAAAGAALPIARADMQGPLAALGISLNAAGYGMGLEYVSLGGPGGQIMRLDDGGEANHVMHYSNGAGAVSTTVKAGGAQVYVPTEALANGVLFKTATRAALNNHRTSHGASLEAASGVAAMPSGITTVRITGNSTGISVPAVRITRAYLIPNRAPSDAELAAMTA